MTATIRKYFVENPEAFDPRAYLKAARAASVEMCKSRYIAFGCEGQASKIKPRRFLKWLASTAKAF